MHASGFILFITFTRETLPMSQLFHMERSTWNMSVPTYSTSQGMYVTGRFALNGFFEGNQ